jgi:hypothetical protein
MLSKLRNGLAIDQNLKGVALVRYIRERSQNLPEFDAESTEFRLQKCFDKIGLSPRANLFINKQHFEEFIEIETQAMDVLFDEIWFPAADDIELFDDTYSWILSVSHDGEIFFLKGQK